MNWIDTSSRKPPVGELVLVVTPTWASQRHLAYWNGGNWDIQGCATPDRVVIYWQPIEEPPKPCCHPPSAADLVRAMRVAIQKATDGCCSARRAAGKVEISGRTFDVFVGVEG